MKFTLASVMAVAASATPFAPKSGNNAKTKYMNNLVRKATTIRKLADDFPVDISTYSVKFEKCQFVRTFDDELAENEEATTILGVTRFAIFRLCPGDCDSCSSNYGEYLVDLESYLELSVEYYQEYQEEMCDACEELCGNANDQQRKRRTRFLEQVDCNSCVDECDKIENMEDNGFVDATEFLQCDKVPLEMENDDDGDAPEFYAAPICTSDGSKIKIGVFSDEECLMYEQNLDIEDFLEYDENGNQMQLSHALLKMTYQETCISCLEVDEDQQYNNYNDGNDAEDEDQVNDFCENMYNVAAKCEYSHGFDTGYYDAYGYENQRAQEDTICDYINSLKAGTYDEEGEINLTGASFSIGGGTQTTAGQKFALTFFVAGTVGLAVYAAMLHSKLTKGAVEATSGSLA